MSTVTGARTSISLNIATRIRLTTRLCARIRGITAGIGSGTGILAARILLWVGGGGPGAQGEQEARN
jgi:hypothetical protein